MTDVQTEACEFLAKHYGLPSQESKIIEECGELIVAIKHKETGRATKEDVVSELADVIILSKQLEVLYGSEDVTGEIHRKLQRQLKRINAARLGE